MCPGCDEGHATQWHWIYQCNHKALVILRTDEHGKIEELLHFVTSPQQAIGRQVMDLVHVGDWSAAQLRATRSAHPYALLYDVRWVYNLIQPHLIQLAQELWDTRRAILTRISVPGTRPRLRKQRFYAVAEGEHKGIHESYADIPIIY